MKKTMEKSVDSVIFRKCAEESGSKWEEPYRYQPAYRP
jgi:hypothetical protein